MSSNHLTPFSSHQVAKGVIADVDENVDEWEPGVPITSPCDSVKVSEGVNPEGGG